jgi:dihydrofolate synthase/folylpolyglutamate synthase
MTYPETLQYLYDMLPMFHRIGAAAYKASLDNIRALCTVLDNPQDKFPSIHIAGTNGKGSTSHTLAAILQSAGYKTGLYTSPHLKSFTERIKINGQDIGEQAVVDFVAQIQPEIDRLNPSFFELTVAMAFTHFANEKVDIAVIEVGMGGRLDATNVITPLISVITNISLDHQQFLGDTLPLIAVEKAGIIKPQVPVVISEYQSEIASVFENIASERHTVLYFAGEDYTVKILEEENFELQVIQKEAIVLDNLNPALKGHYQTKNLVGILKTIELLQNLGWQIHLENIREGIENVTQLTGLKGRWQILQQKPLIICDTAHNEAGIHQVIKQLSSIPTQQLHIVLGLTQDKDILKILKLYPTEAKYYFCQYDAPRALPVGDLADTAQQIGLKGRIFASVIEAFTEARKNATPKDVIFIGGSTFVVAEIPDI